MQNIRDRPIALGAGLLLRGVRPLSDFHHQTLLRKVKYSVDQICWISVSEYLRRNFGGPKHLCGPNDVDHVMFIQHSRTISGPKHNSSL
jgi:hypothetical protein